MRSLKRRGEIRWSLQRRERSTGLLSEGGDLLVAQAKGRSSAGLSNEGGDPLVSSAKREIHCSLKRRGRSAALSSEERDPLVSQAKGRDPLEVQGKRRDPLVSQAKGVDQLVSSAKRRDLLVSQANGRVLYSHLLIHSASQRHNTKDRRMNKGRMLKTQEGRRKKTLEKYLPLTLLQVFERVVQSLHVRGCWRPNINFIIWSNCYDRHVVSFLFSWCWGQLHRNFPRAPFWQLLWHPTQLNYIIIQRPHDRLLDLWNRMFNRHQAEITVMQFRGYSLPVHHCSGTMGPSPCPIS